MWSLGIKEIVPFQGADGKVTFLHERVFVVLKEFGHYSFPKRSDVLKLSAESVREGAPSTHSMSSIVQSLGLASYFPIFDVEWSESKMTCSFQCFEVTPSSSATVPSSSSSAMPSKLSELQNVMKTETGSRMRIQWKEKSLTFEYVVYCLNALHTRTVIHLVRVFF
eukprot:TRINITY_DN1718_c0_g1_i1.p1 TRINITY_DN1718_c0_g1~~TRINITY_DN1718_c0_g1_i1.p1  ORF type:complete len:166 (-),score=30.61 TRINITY_DN1718_c0_g1_i1:67-564(-)